MRAWTDRQRQLVATDAWIIDGNYSATMPVRLAAADTVIFLDLPAVTCLWGILQRRRQYRGNDELSRHLRGRLSWGFVTYIAGYRTNMQPKVRRLLKEHATGVVVTLTSRRAVRRYLRSIPTKHNTREASWS